MEEDKKTFDEALEDFVEMARNKINTYYAERFSNLTAPVLSYETGRRYVKLITSNDGTTGKSVYCFVDKTNGDILKAATWRAPAKHARGSIYDEDCGASAVNQYGANYLR
ncbi:MAG: DUF7717 family protein [bacterium]